MCWLLNLQSCKYLQLKKKKKEWRRPRTDAEVAQLGSKKKIKQDAQTRRKAVLPRSSYMDSIFSHLRFSSRQWNGPCLCVCGQQNESVVVQCNRYQRKKSGHRVWWTSRCVSVPSLSHHWLMDVFMNAAFVACITELAAISTTSNLNSGF